MAQRLLLINYDPLDVDDYGTVGVLELSLREGNYIELPITPEQQKLIDDNDKRAMQS